MSYCVRSEVLVSSTGLWGVSSCPSFSSRSHASVGLSGGGIPAGDSSWRCPLSLSESQSLSTSLRVSTVMASIPISCSIESVLLEGGLGRFRS